MKKTQYLLQLFVLSLLFSCGYKGPENLPKLKKRFKTQIENFEKQKETTDKKVEDGVEKLTVFEEALKNAENADKEFKRIYNQWHKVNNNVNKLNKEYNKLKNDAEELFTAMQDQTNSLNDAATKNELSKALTKSKTDYFKILSKTKIAIDKLNGLHSEAVDIIKALEVAVALGQISDIQTGLKGIESKVAGIMDELNVTIKESKALYEKRMSGM